MQVAIPKNLVIYMDAFPDGPHEYAFQRDLSEFYPPRERVRSESESLDTMIQTPFQFDLSIERKGEELLLSGSIRAHIKKECDRCLIPFERDLADTFELILIPEARDLHRKDSVVELQYEDLSVVTYSHKSIDLKPILREQIELLFPIQYLCQESCKGLCPQCGVNLNTGTCTCENQPDWGNRPFRSLDSGKD